jgi:hypothetical protein
LSDDDVHTIAAVVSKVLGSAVHAVE